MLSFAISQDFLQRPDIMTELFLKVWKRPSQMCVKPLIWLGLFCSTFMTFWLTCPLCLIGFSRWNRLEKGSWAAHRMKRQLNGLLRLLISPWTLNSCAQAHRHRDLQWDSAEFFWSCILIFAFAHHVTGWKKENSSLLNQAWGKPCWIKWALLLTAPHSRSLFQGPRI